jgi:hypothetical protein
MIQMWYFWSEEEEEEEEVTITKCNFLQNKQVNAELCLRLTSLSNKIICP